MVRTSVLPYLIAGTAWIFVAAWALDFPREWYTDSGWSSISNSERLVFLFAGPCG